MNPDIKKDKWSAAEDARLIQLVEVHGGAWAEIARQYVWGSLQRMLQYLQTHTLITHSMPGRTDQQCMGRWKRHLDPGISRAPWTPEEDALLRKMVGEHGHAWSTISNALEGRIAQQCRSRWKQLNGNNTVSKLWGVLFRTINYYSEALNHECSPSAPPLLATPPFPHHHNAPSPIALGPTHCTQNSPSPGQPPPSTPPRLPPLL